MGTRGRIFHLPFRPSPEYPERVVTSPRSDEPAHEPLAYYRVPAEPPEEIGPRLLPCVFWVLGVAAVAAGLLGEYAVGGILMCYLCGAGFFLSLDGVRRPGRFWFVSLCGLVLNALVFAVAIAGAGWSVLARW